MTDSRWADAVAKKRPTVVVLDDDHAQLCNYAEELYLHDFDVVALHALPGLRSSQKMRSGIPVHEVSSMRDILEKMREIQPDAVLSDWNLEWDNIDGHTVLHELQYELPGTVLALHSTKFDYEGPRAVVQEDGHSCFPKKFGLARVAEYFNTQLASKDRGIA